MAAATPRPWRISPVRDRDRFWVEGPVGSAASERFPKDRRTVLYFPLYGDAALDAEAEENAKLMLERVNGGEG